jgi:hypothetical protein
MPSCQHGSQTLDVGDRFTFGAPPAGVIWIPNIGMLSNRSLQSKISREFEHCRGGPLDQRSSREMVRG